MKVFYKVSMIYLVVVYSRKTSNTTVGSQSSCLMRTVYVFVALFFVKQLDRKILLKNHRGVRIHIYAIIVMGWNSISFFAGFFCD